MLNRLWNLVWTFILFQILFLGSMLFSTFLDHYLSHLGMIHRTALSALLEILFEVNIIQPIPDFQNPYNQSRQSKEFPGLSRGVCYKLKKHSLRWAMLTKITATCVCTAAKNFLLVQQSLFLKTSLGEGLGVQLSWRVRDYLSSIHDSLVFLSSELHKLCVLMHTCNSWTLEVEAGGSRSSCVMS